MPTQTARLYKPCNFRSICDRRPRALLGLPDLAYKPWQPTCMGPQGGPADYARCACGGQRRVYPERAATEVPAPPRAPSACHPESDGTRITESPQVKAYPDQPLPRRNMGQQCGPWPKGNAEAWRSANQLSTLGQP